MAWWRFVCSAKQISCSSLACPWPRGSRFPIFYQLRRRFIAHADGRSDTTCLELGIWNLNYARPSKTQSFPESDQPFESFHLMPLQDNSLDTTKQIPHSTWKSACCPARSTKFLPMLTKISYLRFHQRCCQQDLDYQNSQTFSQDSIPLLGAIPSLHPTQHHLGPRLATCSIFAAYCLTTPSISSIRRIRAFQS